jgi:hypothetical protein
MVLPLSYELWAFPYRLALCFPSVASGIWYSDLVCDSLFWLDAFLALRTIVPATSVDQGEPITSLAKIAVHYFTQRFPYELFPTFLYLAASPICASYLPSTCEGSVGPFPTNATSPPRKFMPGVVRDEYNVEAPGNLISRGCFDLWPFWVWWASTLFRLFPRALRLSRYFKEMKVNLDVSIKTVQVFYISMVIFMTSHWVGCAFFFLARLRYADDTTWLSDMELLLPLYDAHHSPMLTQYIICVYNGFSSLTSLGYATYVPNNMGEVLLSFLVITAQVLQTGVIFGTVINYMNERDPVEEAHKKQMEDLHTFLDSKQLPQDLRERIVKHFEFQHKKAIENKSSRVDLPRSLEIKVANFKYRSVVAGCTARGQVFAGCNLQFLNALLTRLRVVFLMPGEEVFKKGDLSRELALVLHGACTVMNDDKVKRVVRNDVAEHSSALGEVPFFFGIVHHFHVRAYPDGDVQLLVLSKADGDELFHNYPEQLEIIRGNLLSAIGLDEAGNSVAAADQEEDDPDVAVVKEEIRESLKSHADETFTALTYAARSGDLEEVASLIRRGAQINHVDYDGRGALAMVSDARGGRGGGLGCGGGLEGRGRGGLAPRGPRRRLLRNHIYRRLLRDDI